MTTYAGGYTPRPTPPPATPKRRLINRFGQPNVIGLGWRPVDLDDEAGE